MDKMLEQVFGKGGKIVDIGGGLNVMRSNRIHNPAFAKNRKYLAYPNVDYQVLDKLPTYDPHIVADVRSMPFKDGEVDAFVVWRILEYVEEPQKAVDEIFRCLKPGGVVFFEFFFFHTYSSFPGYYTDFYRFTEDGVRHLLRNFSELEVEPTMGALSTWLYLAFPKVEKYHHLIDKIRPGGRNVRGFRVIARKSL